jgi:hypothetical protein
MNEIGGQEQLGRFVIGNGIVHGALTVAGPNSSLVLHDENEFIPQDAPHRYIPGTLNDLTKVSLHGCVTTRGLGHTRRGNEIYYSAKIFPHVVISGDRHIAPNEKAITKVHLSVDDATTLFEDLTAFGFILDGTPLIQSVVEVTEKAIGQKIRTGPESNILYFTGAKEIFACDTVLGRVSASHNPQPTSLGGPQGVGLRNTIFVSIEFTERLTIQESINRISAPLRFLEIVAGRPQNIVALSVRAEYDQDSPTGFKLYWNLGPKRENEGSKPESYDLLLDAVRQPSEFSNVLTNWLAGDEERFHARMRFANSFAGQNHYTVNRIVGAANMFDLLPTSATPADVPISSELESARTVSRCAFRALPPSAERDSVLGALGRIGTASLKQKIRHRAAKIITEVGSQFPDLPKVIDEAVICRNYYVHGSEPRFDYDHHFHAVTFFIDLLEFVFAASDFIEAGWDITDWCGRGTLMSHPFSRLRINYALRLEELKKLI